MTHILVDRESNNIKQRVEKSSHYKSLPGIHELQMRRKFGGGITPEEFNDIRSFSRQSWESECAEQDPIKSSFPTTYSSFHHSGRHSQLEGAQYRSKSRPHSPTRRNNPHPCRPFLTLRLKDAPGFEDHTVKAGQSPYKVGKAYNKSDIYTEKQLHYSTPNYESNEPKIIRGAMSPHRIPAAQAWLNEASTDERKVVLDMLESCSRFRTTSQEMSSLMKPQPKVSMHRWLKRAGAEEEQLLARISQPIRQDPHKVTDINTRYIGKQGPNRYVLGKYESSHGSGNSGRPVGERYVTAERVTRRPYRTDFTVHPELVP